MNDELWMLPPALQFRLRQLAWLVCFLTRPVQSVEQQPDGELAWRNRCPLCSAASKETIAASTGLRSTLAMARELPLDHSSTCGLTMAQELLQQDPRIRRWAEGAVINFEDADALGNGISWPTIAEGAVTNFEDVGRAHVPDSE